MNNNSNVLTIGTESTGDFESTKTRNEYSVSDFEKHLQKILLNGGKPLTNVCDEGSVERFAAKEIKKNGYYYEFGPADKINGWMISGPTFDSKGILGRLKNVIGKEHWISKNVAKYPKDSRNFIIKTVSNALDQERSDIYSYLCYLNENTKRR
uniref:IP15503p1 n=1 Tax=Drosophila melanogaster TaxID=7227 RepID=B7YZN1_DROME|nr:uncharacterized protein Dmel_CG42362, isoform A [Drosophila melanogaster]NP_001286687.1 uncharacterized protein Dmel_CG42362, isoform B [Drosophila melanogaster]ACL83185.1 uncharacterized protein Dmel_CG42362, isoform A [Drosophila melanogaster]AGK45243.1 IP15503p1 [Drosophila melanogaster]AHN56482.1 uncharacterized protein Dmel_CG42362, isoform B [Drosophila melanogaster]|eukprot:NP_001137731.1 uncharacterized protein Dmel_CG42362, isoform A [Drosophila melanogaster]